MANSNSSQKRSEEELRVSTLNDLSNNNNLELKINPKYEIQIRALTSSEYMMLRNSIQEIGQRVPIITDKDGNIIEGHHRFKICIELRN